MKFSFVTPCFNAKNHIRECIESVLFVCEGLSFEHIIVDAVSTDGTLDVIREYNHIKLISEKDKGMYDALNKGIALARGEVIGHLNSDEQYNKLGFQEAVAQFDIKTDAVMGPTVMINEEKVFIQLFNQIIVPRPIDAVWGMPIQTCSFLFRKPIWERFHFDIKYKIAGDHHWFKKQMDLGLNIKAIKTPIGIFTWRKSRLSVEGLGLTQVEDPLEGIRRDSFTANIAKRYYRLRKLLAGGYSTKPIVYQYFEGKSLRESQIQKPALKVKTSIFK